MELLGFVADFEWDHANIWHLWRRHHVTPDEVEEVFAGQFKLRRGQVRRGVKYYEALGRTLLGRYLFVVYRVKKGQIIRVGTARPMTQSERRWYAKKDLKPRKIPSS